jgi:ArsR family transcriptional regulator
MDLIAHTFEEARELYADVWLGFTQVDLLEMMRKSGFGDLDVAVVHREPETPHFETLMAIGVKPS